MRTKVPIQNAPFPPPQPAATPGQGGASNLLLGTPYPISKPNLVSAVAGQNTMFPILIQTIEKIKKFWSTLDIGAKDVIHIRVSHPISTVLCNLSPPPPCPRPRSRRRRVAPALTLFSNHCVACRIANVAMSRFRASSTR
jgi:hypothetical protein